MKFLSAFLLMGSASAVTFSAAEIGYFNLMGLCGNLCVCGTTLLGPCPNLAAFESASGSAGVTTKNADGSITTKSDVIASVISTIGAPANVLSYYSTQTSINWAFSSMTAGEIVKDFADFLKGDFSAMVSASGSAEVMAYVVDEIFEFTSADGSGVFNPTNDKQVSSTPMASIAWKPMTVTVTGQNTVISAVDATGNYNFTWTMAAQYASLSNGAVLTPNSTKLDITINFPYTLDTTYLGLRMILMGANAAGAAQANVDVKNQQVTAGNSYISWVGNAQAGASLSNSVAVTASASSNQDASYFNSQTNLLSTLKSMAGASGSATAYLNVNYFSFNAKKASGKVYWDPSIGYGQNPAINTGLSAGAIAGIVIAVLAVLGVAGFFAFRWHKNRAGSSTAYSSSGYA